MKKIGITGTIAAGKTTVSILLKRYGFPVFNSDQYSRLALRSGAPTYDAVVKEFGTDILAEDGEVDRAALAAVVFSDEEKRKKLNSIVHPFVIEGMNRFFENHSDLPLVFAEVPLLYECGLESYFDEVCVVTCTKETAAERMMEDRGYTREEAENRYASQISQNEQVTKADTVIHNDGDLQELNSEVRKWVRTLREQVRNGCKN